LHQSYREGQEDQLGALGLAVNAVVIWNTKYMELALDAIEQTGEMVLDSEVQRLSPHGYEHINIVGRYSFVLPKEIENGGLRSLLSAYKTNSSISREKSSQGLNRHMSLNLNSSGGSLPVFSIYVSRISKMDR